MTSQELVSFHAALLARHNADDVVVEQAAGEDAGKGARTLAVEQAEKALQLMGLSHRSNTMVGGGGRGLGRVWGWAGSRAGVGWGGGGGGLGACRCRAPPIAR